MSRRSLATAGATTLGVGVAAAVTLSTPAGAAWAAPVIAKVVSPPRAAASAPDVPENIAVHFEGTKTTRSSSGRASVTYPSTLVAVVTAGNATEAGIFIDGTVGRDRVMDKVGIFYDVTASQFSGPYLIPSAGTPTLNGAAVSGIVYRGKWLWQINRVLKAGDTIRIPLVITPTDKVFNRSRGGVVANMLDAGVTYVDANAADDAASQSWQVTSPWETYSGEVSLLGETETAPNLEGKTYAQPGSVRIRVSEGFPADRVVDIPAEGIYFEISNYVQYSADYDYVDASGTVRTWRYYTTVSTPPSGIGIPLLDGIARPGAVRWGGTSSRPRLAVTVPLVSGSVFEIPLQWAGLNPPARPGYTNPRLAGLTSTVELVTSVLPRLEPSIFVPSPGNVSVRSFQKTY